MIAVILAVICAAAAVAVSHSFLGPSGSRAGPYVTTTAPLFCAIYVAWIAHGSTETRRMIHLVLCPW